MNGSSKTRVLIVSHPIRILTVLLILMLLLPFSGGLVEAATLLSATFDAGNDGFTYQDDAFGTSQPNYASGTRVATGGYGGTGGLQVTLGSTTATAVTGMSGGWSYTLNLAAAETGVKLAFRYKLDHLTAAYTYDEYLRMLVKVDGTQYGRGAKNYVDHIGGDGSSTQGNSNTFLPTTDWQQATIYLGNLAAGNHTIVLGGYNNKKAAVIESMTATIDNVVLTSGNAAPAASGPQTVVNRLSFTQYKSDLQSVANFGDRCHMTGCSTTSYYNALAWTETQLQAMGYTTVRHEYTSGSYTGTNLYATKVGTGRPDQMYMITAMFDGRGGGQAADDNASGVSLAMQAARMLAGADVQTDKSVRFIFFDQEESGLIGSAAYVSGRRTLQGIENPAGSGKYPEPTWLGLVNHDMVLYDHGAGTAGASQSSYADLDVEWRAGTTKEADSKALALKWAFASGAYATDYPATAYNYSTNTDDTSFHPYVASVSVRENRRSLTSGGNAEWINPNYHTANDLYSKYSDADFRLGFNATQITLGIVAELAGATITTANTPPVANAQAVTTAEDTAKAITLTGSDADGNPLTYSVVTNPAHGTLSGTAPSLTYSPAANYNGADSFTFKVNDGKVDSAAATVSITVSTVNDPPVANAQAVTTAEDTAKAITLTGLDVEGSALTYGVVTNPAHGTLSGTAPNLTYTPAANYNGSDSFTFKVNDGTVDSAAATVSITVSAVNDPPVANAQAMTTAEDTAKAITLTGSDVEGNPLTYSVVTNPAHGTLCGTAPNLTYTPAANYNGSDSFTFKVYDGTVDSAAATVSITVSTVNDPPVANAQAMTTAEDTAKAITLSGSDVEGNPLTYSVVTNPAHGTLSGTAPNLTYTPATNYNGSDSFTFKVNDGTVDSAVAAINITVTRSTMRPSRMRRR